MTARTLQREANAYITAVRTALRDVPANERESAVRDVEANLADVIVDLAEDAHAGSLHDRLGTPDQYAAELRESAGYGPAPVPFTERLWGREVRWTNVILCTGIIAFAYGLYWAVTEFHTHAFWRTPEPLLDDPLYSMGPAVVTLAGAIFLAWAVKRGLPRSLSSWLSRDNLPTPVATIRRYAFWVLRGWSAIFTLDYLILGEGRLARWVSPGAGPVVPTEDPFVYLTHWALAIPLATAVTLSIVVGPSERSLGDWRIFPVIFNAILVFWVPLAWYFHFI